MSGTGANGPAPASDDEPSWDRVKDIFADALELPASERGTFLDGACAGDLTLRQEVDSLLAEAGESDHTAFLEVPAMRILDVPAPEVGTDIGGYHLRGIIGEGGMGRVFEATQERPHRTVALKVLRPGFLPPDAERRFHWEVEALGRLSHPAIAAVHDAGVEVSPDGHAVSWFAMEKVNGRPLFVAADALGMDRRARLALFLRIADAIAHAHQRGIIHRDLKPDNILVDDDGAPHVLDFGIARASDPLASSVTTQGEILGTIAYMSPEQVLGEPEKVDARSDVYALGVLLYRLLTSEPPLLLEGLSLPKVALRLSQEDPRPARSLDPGLKGDLDTILSVALERDVERRYPTVEAFAADVRRSLNDEPIQARPETAAVQLLKFARRNRGLVAGAALALLALVVGLVGTTVGFVRAADARDDAQVDRRRAELERDRSNDANRFLREVFASVQPGIYGRDVRVADLLDGAAEELDREADLDPAVSAGLNLTVGDTYRRLGLQPEARVRLEVALASFSVFDGEDSDGALESAGALVEVLLDLGDVDAADPVIARLERGVAARVRRSVDEGTALPDWIRIRPIELAAARADTVGDIDGYVARSREMFAEWSGLHPAGDDRVETARINFSNALLAAGLYEEADELLGEGIAVLTGIGGGEGETAMTLRSNLMLAVMEAGERTRALDIAEGIEPRVDEVWGPAHPKTLAFRNNHASALEEFGRLEEGLAVRERILATAQEHFGTGHEETLTARNNLAVVLMRLQRYAEAHAVLEISMRELAGERGETFPLLLLQTQMNLGPALERIGRAEEALVVQRSVLEKFEQIFGEGNPETLITRNNLAMTLLSNGRAEEAEALARRNLELAEESQPGHRNNTFPFRSNLARALGATGSYQEAIGELQAVETILAADPEATAIERDRVQELLLGLRAEWAQ